MPTTFMVIPITIVAYLIMMIVIGVLFSRKNKNVSDFYLGGRKLGPFVTAMSAEASDMSSWLLMGLPGVAYLSGCAEAGWTAIGLAVGTYLNWLFVAKRLRVYSQKVGAITVPDFFSNRYHDKNKVLMGISALIILIFFVPYTASGFSACGKLFSTIFGWDYHLAMIISAVVIIIYTCFGGFLAASFTDLIQSIVMTVALISIIVFGISKAGGIDAVIDNAKSIEGYLSLTNIHNAETNGSDPYGFLTTVSTLAWGLGYFGMPHIILRFMAIEDKNKIKTSRRIASVWVVISMAVAIFIGFIGNLLSKQNVIEQLEDSEKIIIKTALFMSENGLLLAIVAGLVFAGILACTMSTSDSQLLAASSSMSENILKGVFNIKLNEKKSMLTARAVLFVIAVLGVILAWNENSSVFRVVSFAWAGFGATFGPVMLAALFWKRSNKAGAVAGMITGGVMVFLWKFVIAKLGGIFAIYELLPAFLTAVIAIVIVSLVTSAPEKEITEEFDSVSAEIHQ
ncbi:sodium/proline symporter PutP [Ruminococcus albus]|uniref:Sodium/proline symporter n=1 Tax=Ruminococcus albus TaxID=1264 RepID=A0A1H7I6F3_RUMAL|nr:sodium/proline symporter PutP [Ruminococcus albus]SEK58119.1 sodium/proline symporter [Ruminococcus albus]